MRMGGKCDFGDDFTTPAGVEFGGQKKSSIGNSIVNGDIPSWIKFDSFRVGGP
ncbi:hypothetical protein SAMN05444412_105140 [Rhodonellum ikkaensis]|uniref:Uncharacterized protein n=1 Tax=Rhodonellum ikkaensis TaxID=336829 RepID=A0A1H3Q018_9BACT|nr:hypothetical protein SAMN05444412_105140 [Rhodonellum ikkaensis]